MISPYHYTFILFLIFSLVLRGSHGLKFAAVLKLLLLSQSVLFHSSVELLETKVFMVRSSGGGKEIRSTEFSVSLLLVMFHSTRMNQYCSLHSYLVLKQD